MTAINIFSLISYDTGSNDPQNSFRMLFHATDESNEKLRGRDDLDASKKINFKNQPSALIANSPMDEKKSFHRSNFFTKALSRNRRIERKIKRKG